MTLWLQDFYWDFLQLNDFYNNKLALRGAKETTGPQASFLFNGDEDKVDKMELGCTDNNSKNGNKKQITPITGQTYSRKIEYMMLSILSGIGQSVHKMSNDFRLLQLLSSFGEIEKPFESKQVGSSAMAYKRNPMVVNVRIVYHVIYKD